MLAQRLTLLATVDELSGVDALGSNEELRPLLEPVWVTEGHFGQGGTTARVVDNVLQGETSRKDITNPSTLTTAQNSSNLSSNYLHNPLDVTMAFSEVNVTEFSSTFPVLDVGFKHRARTFSLSPDYTSHRVLKNRAFNEEKKSYIVVSCLKIKSSISIKQVKTERNMWLPL